MAGDGHVPPCYIKIHGRCDSAEPLVKYKSKNYYRLSTVEDIQKAIMTGGPVSAPLKPKRTHRQKADSPTLPPFPVRRLRSRPASSCIRASSRTKVECTAGRGGTSPTSSREGTPSRSSGGVSRTRSPIGSLRTPGGQPGDSTDTSRSRGESTSASSRRPCTAATLTSTTWRKKPWEGPQKKLRFTKKKKNTLPSFCSSAPLAKPCRSSPLRAEALHLLARGRVKPKRLRLLVHHEKLPCLDASLFSNVPRVSQAQAGGNAAYGGNGDAVDAPDTIQTTPAAARL